MAFGNLNMIMIGQQYWSHFLLLFPLSSGRSNLDKEILLKMILDMKNQTEQRIQDFLQDINDQLPRYIRNLIFQHLDKDEQFLIPCQSDSENTEAFKIGVNFDQKVKDSDPSRQHVKHPYIVHLAKEGEYSKLKAYLQFLRLE